MSDLIREFDGRTLEEWAQWYQQRNPESIAEATRMIYNKIFELRRVIDNISDEMIESWVKDLVLVKTFVGLRFQEAILRKVAEKTGKTYRLSYPDEEARGIDGVIGETKVTIKPGSWTDQLIHREELEGVLIIYRKTDDGLVLEYQPSDFGMTS